MRFSFHVADVVNAFPGVAAGQPFFVVPEPAILGRLQAVPGSSPGPTQVWATGGSDPVAAAHRAGLVVDSATTAATLERTFAINPQSLALGMHFTAAAGGMVLVVVGVAVGLYFIQRRRRYEFATLRAFGTDRRTLLRMMVGEQAAIVGFSLVTSFMLAWWLLELMMPILGPSITSAFPAPVLAMDWPAVALFALAITAAAAVSLALALKDTLATSVTSVLRGEVE
jgi:predicted lysophospholipase L1 biosynthesis ABC-type transport system permease subunit